MLDAAFDLLGRKVKDKITGVVGVAVSVSFDLYGCVQVIIKPPAKEDGTQIDGWWTDISRLEVLDGERIMEPPDFGTMDLAAPTPKKVPGPAEKPAPA